MKATLTYFEHMCAEHECCGDVVKRTNSVSIVRKWMLRVDGKIKFMGKHADALAFAKAHGIEVLE